MDKLKALRAFLSKVLKMTDGDIDAILDASDATEETALEAFLAKDRERIALLTKSKPGQSFQDGYKKAKAEVLAEFEKSVREKYGIDNEDLTGIELIAEVITKEKPAGNKDAITEEEIKKHPTYLKLEKEKTKALADKEKEWKDKLDAREKEFSKSETFGSVSKSALDILNGLNPVLSQNAKVAATQQADFIRDLEGFSYEKQDDGSFIILDKEGKRVEDGHGNPKTLDDLVKERAEIRFDFKANNGGGNPGGNGKPGDGKDGKPGSKKYPTGVQKPKTLEELTRLMNDKAIKTEDRATIMETWEAENPNT